jgi:hypothetical protein
MYENIGLPCDIKELVTKSLAGMCPRHKARYVHQLDRDEPVAVYAYRVDWVILHTKLPTDTFCSSISYTYIGLDCCKGIVCYRNRKVCGCIKESGFAYIGLANQAYYHVAASLWLIPPLMSSFET